tara:strand:+ start:1552 stop:1728 length:177 start_codon:yes stop_codon:yes gene_type:complete
MKLTTAVVAALGVLVAQTHALPQFENVDCNSCNDAFQFCKDVSKALTAATTRRFEAER